MSLRLVWNVLVYVFAAFGFIMVLIVVLVVSVDEFQPPRWGKGDS